MGSPDFVTAPSGVAGSGDDVPGSAQSHGIHQSCRSIAASASAGAGALTGPSLRMRCCPAISLCSLLLSPPPPPPSQVAVACHRLRLRPLHCSTSGSGGPFLSLSDASWTHPVELAPMALPCHSPPHSPSRCYIYSSPYFNHDRIGFGAPGHHRLIVSSGSARSTLHWSWRCQRHSMVQASIRYLSVAVVTTGTEALGWRSAVSSRATEFKLCRLLHEEKGSRATKELQKSSLSAVIFHQVDVADRASIMLLVGFVEAKFGRLDILTWRRALLQPAPPSHSAFGFLK